MEVCGEHPSPTDLAPGKELRKARCVSETSWKIWRKTCLVPTGIRNPACSARNLLKVLYLYSWFTRNQWPYPFKAKCQLYALLSHSVFCHTVYFVCVCVCVCARARVCACVCVRACVGVCVMWFSEHLRVLPWTGLKPIGLSNEKRLCSLWGSNIFLYVPEHCNLSEDIQQSFLTVNY